MMWQTPFRYLLLFAVTTMLCFGGGLSPAGAEEWTADERGVMRSLWIGSLPALPPDPTNPFGDDPRAADFGHRLFFDNRLSANDAVACVGCHLPSRAFTDGRRFSRGLGQTARNAPTLVGAAYSPWFFWDGRKDSQWAQALAPFESPVEHGIDRGRVIAVIRADRDLHRRYREIFGELPTPDDRRGTTRAFSNIGKAIAAYERRLIPGPGKFDRYVAAILKNAAPEPADELTLDEILGFRAFIADNQGQCLRCHNGPLLTNHDFHNIGLQGPAPAELAHGRMFGIRTALADEFNCLGKHAGAPPEACAELRFAKHDDPSLIGRFKTPTLRNLPRTAPYMHTGEFRTINDALWHYRDRFDARVGTSELEPLTIAGVQFEQIEAFLRTLDGPIAADPKYLRPPSQP